MLKKILVALLALLIIVTPAMATCPTTWNNPNLTCINTQNWLDFVNNWTYQNTSIWSNFGNYPTITSVNTWISSNNSATLAAADSHIASNVSAVESLIGGWISQNNTATLTQANNAVWANATLFGNTSFPPTSTTGDLLKFSNTGGHTVSDSGIGASQVFLTNGSTAMTATANMGGYNVTGVGAPVSGNDAINLTYFNLNKGGGSGSGSVTNTSLATIGNVTQFSAANGTQISDSGVSSSSLITTSNIDTYVPSRNKNLIINGGFQVNQRGYISGNTLNSTFIDGYGFDRWRYGSNNSAVLTFSQNASTYPQTITITQNSTEQIIENINVIGGTYTLSWTGNATARIGYGATVADARSALTGTFATSPITITSVPAGDYIAVEMATSNAAGKTAAQPTGAGSLGYVQLESGNVATPWEWLGYETVLQKCQRFAYFVGNYGSTFYFTPNGVKYNSATLAGSILFPSRMRAVPTLYTSSPTWATTTPSNNQIAAQDITSGGSYLTISGAFSLAYYGYVYGGQLYLSAGTSFSGTNGDIIFIQMGQTAWVLFSAEL